jgi:cytidylate kinase
MTVIALDGPAGAGKSTIARLVAEKLGLEVLDTGAMYRAVTYAVLAAGADPADPATATASAQNAAIRLTGGRVFVDGEDVSEEIRATAVSDAVSVVAAHPGVRTVLRDLQRAWMDERHGGVVEGRDIGTVVFPDAEVKIFLTASPEVRAARRAGEGVMDVTTAAANIATRDRLDSTRHDSPLRAADDARLLDTSEMTIDQVVATIVAAAQ